MAEIKTKRINPPIEPVSNPLSKTEPKLNREQLLSFYRYIREYIEEFTRINPQRHHYSVEEGSEIVKTTTNKPVVITTNPKIDEMKINIVNSTNYPPINLKSIVEDPNAEPPNSGPNMVVDAILNMPPTVTINASKNPDKVEKIEVNPPLGKDKPIEIVKATQVDIDFANRKTITPNLNKVAKAMLEYLIEKCKVYIKKPLQINDGFGTSKEGHKGVGGRRDYENGIKTALEHLGPRWSLAFQRRWDNLRLTKNSQVPVLTAFLSVIKSLNQTMSLEIRNNLFPKLQPLEQPALGAFYLTQKQKYVESAPEVLRISRAIVEIFAEENATFTEINEKRIPRYQSKFIRSIFGQLFANRTILDNSLLFSQIDEKIKDKVYERLYPFLKALIEYTEDDFAEIFKKIENLDNNEVKYRKGNEGLEAMRHAVWSIFTYSRENIPG